MRRGGALMGKKREVGSEERKAGKVGV